jgi:hypothetical protein
MGQMDSLTAEVLVGALALLGIGVTDLAMILVASVNFWLSP